MLSAAMLMLPALLHAQIAREHHSGIDFYVGSGVAAKDGATIIPFEVIISKPILPGLSVGLGGGYESYKMKGASSSAIPLFLNSKVAFGLGKGVSFLGDLRIGYSIGQDTKVKVGKKEYTYDGANGFLLGIYPAGLRFSLGKCIDLDFGLGGSLLMPTGGGKSEFYYGGRLGLNFHRANQPVDYAYSGNIVKPKKPKKIYPTRVNGFELGLEGTALNGYGVGLLLGYKLNPKISFALGMEVTGGRDYDMPEYTESYYRMKDGEGEPFRVSKTEKEEGGFSDTWISFFVRGEYRFFNKRFSPIARLDLGYRGSASGVKLRRATIDSNAFDAKSESVGGVMLQPAVGVSLRCTNNSYLEATVGYQYTPD